jgi:uncharacterized membrane protein
MTGKGSDGNNQAAADSQKGLWRTIRDSTLNFARVLGFGIVTGYIFGIAIYIVCFVIAFRMSPEEWWLNLLLCFFGGIVGWSAGVLLSPVTPSQKETFAGYGKALSAFVSGFVVAKLEVLLKTFGGALDYNAVTIGRLLLFGTTFFLGFQFTFIARWKESDDRKANEPPTPST